VRVLGPTTGTTLLPAGSSTSTGTANFTPNPDLTQSGASFDGRLATNAAFADSPRLARVAFRQRPGEVVAEFANFLFNPTIVKICKNVTGTLAPGGSFNFTVGFTNTAGLGGNIFPTATAPVSVISAVGAPPVNPFPSCTVVDGGTFPGGDFNVGQEIVVTEAASAGSTLVRCDSPTNGGTIFPAGGVVPAGSRECRVTLVSGVNILAFTNGPATAPEPGTRAAFDFDGDGKSDASIFRASTGTWSYAASGADNQIRSGRWGTQGDIAVAADYDADGKSDYAVFRPSTGDWFINGSSAGLKTYRFGQAGDIPQAGDYDGDGSADVAVFRPSNGTWYMMGSRAGFSAVQFGVSTDTPVAADFDGDGKTDQAVYRRSTGAWYINRSNGGFAGVAWGTATDVAIPADFDGDGRANIAVYRAGTWFILKGMGGTDYTAINWGLATDKPVAADFDGDRKADAAVFRSGMWFILRSAQTAASFQSIQLGDNADQIVPAPLQ
jgi:hypothetical protein